MDAMSIARLDYQASKYGADLMAQSAKQANDTNVKLANQATQTNIAEAQKNRQFNASEAEKQRVWQKSMSDTAHQREVADMLAAGLNPILSATGGQGASTPSGGTASGTAASAAQAKVDATMKVNPYKSIAQSVISAKQLGISAGRLALDTRRLTELDMQNAVYQRDMMAASAEQARAEAELKKQQAAWYTPGKILSGAAWAAGAYGLAHSKDDDKKPPKPPRTKSYSNPYAEPRFGGMPFPGVIPFPSPVPVPAL